MKWKPWIDFKKDIEILSISCPPCTECRYFKPRREYDKCGIYSGVVLCNTPREMEQDFSCYREEGDPIDRK
jgi:hypothetical protein